LIETPLFPGYLFVSVQPYPEYFINVLKTAGAVCLVCTEPGHPTPVDDDEMFSLRLLVESGSELDIYPSLREGNRVRIRRGPLKGAEGILTHKEESCMFLVTVSLLGRTVGVKICAEDLEAA
jgi:transcription antitermination factor NusG